MVERAMEYWGEVWDKKSKKVVLVTWAVAIESILCLKYQVSRFHTVL